MRVTHLDPSPPPDSPKVAGRRIGEAGVEAVDWYLAEEAAIAFLINGEPFAVMMATPADLEDFALGFLFTEQIIRHPDQLTELRIMPVTDGFTLNCIVPGFTADVRRRTLTGRSGCGICGTETLAEALPRLPKVSGTHPAPDTIRAAFASLPQLQPQNAVNHSTHAAAFFSLDGKMTLAREDVGRHNGLDKLAGALLRQGLDPAFGFIVLSSRMSVEMVQKAVILGSPFLASVSAPTALALRIAKRAGLGVAARSGDGVVLF